MLFVWPPRFRWYSETSLLRTVSLRQLVCATQSRLCTGFWVCWSIRGAIFGFVLQFRKFGSSGEFRWFVSAFARTRYYVAPLSGESSARSYVWVRRCFLVAGCPTQLGARMLARKFPLEMIKAMLCYLLLLNYHVKSFLLLNAELTFHCLLKDLHFRV